jgi:hypothetical protein
MGTQTANLADQYVEIIGRVNAADNSIQGASRSSPVPWQV